MSKNVLNYKKAKKISKAYLKRMNPASTVERFTITNNDETFDTSGLPSAIVKVDGLEVNFRELANIYQHETIDNKDGTFTHIFK